MRAKSFFPGFRKDLEAFYSDDEIAERQQRREQEEKTEQEGSISYILDNFDMMEEMNPVLVVPGRSSRNAISGGRKRSWRNHGRGKY